MKLWQQVLLLLLCGAAIVSRRPDALFHPQFYAEDGVVWYAQAYNVGWLRALALPEGGYLNTLPRLVSAFALLVPFHLAPIVLNLFGIAIQILPVAVLLSSRSAAWGSLPVRSLQAAIYIALPNSSEIDVTITNAHWHLALVLCLILFAGPPPSRGWMVFDVSAALLGGLTGPWALVLTPLTLVFWWIRRQRWSLTMIAVLSLCALTQAAELATSSTRPGTPLGATPGLFVHLISGQIYLAALWGQNGFAWRNQLALAAPGFLLGTAILVYGVVRFRLEYRLFITFSLLILAASLISPLVQGPLPRWEILARDAGARYWFFPMLAFLWSLLWCAVDQQRPPLRLFSILLLAVGLHGIWRDWQYSPYQDEHFAFYAGKFEHLSPGTKWIIPIYPDPHQMELIRK